MKDTQEERIMLKIENLTKVYGDKKAVKSSTAFFSPYILVKFSILSIISPPVYVLLYDRPPHFSTIGLH